MKTSFVCSSAHYPVNAWLHSGIQENECHQQIELVRRVSELSGGELLFLISFTEMPHGRGWSPHIWEIEAGARVITLSLLEATEPVDSGPIWAKREVFVPDHVLWNEINEQLSESELELIKFADLQVSKILLLPQDRFADPIYQPRRNPANTEMDPHHRQAAQFDRLRVFNPYRPPAFVNPRGHRHKLILEKLGD